MFYKYINDIQNIYDIIQYIKMNIKVNYNNYFKKN